MYKNKIAYSCDNFNKSHDVEKHKFGSHGHFKCFIIIIFLILHSFSKLLTRKKFKLVSSLASALFVALAGLVFQSSLMQAQATGTTTVFFKECDSCTRSSDNAPLGLSVVEGYTATITINRVHSLGNYSQPLTVQVTISDLHGQFAKNEETKNITFPAFDNSESFEVQTNRYRYINESGSINVEIDDGTGYNIFTGANNLYRRDDAT